MEALDAVKKFQLTKENYAKAVEFLSKKHADSEKLIITHMDKLDNCQLYSITVHDQRKLFEHLQLIVTQLKAKGENLNNQCMFENIFTKFSNKIQRKVIEKKHDVVMEKPFQMEQFLKFIDEVISEEKARQYTSKRQSMSTAVSKQKYKSRSWISNRTYCFMYCRADHKAFKCDIYKMPYERSQYLRTNKLCSISHSDTTTQFIAEVIWLQIRETVPYFMLSPINADGDELSEPDRKANQTATRSLKTGNLALRRLRCASRRRKPTMSIKNKKSLHHRRPLP